MVLSGETASVIIGAIIAGLIGIFTVYFTKYIEEKRNKKVVSKALFIEITLHQKQLTDLVECGKMWHEIIDEDDIADLKSLFTVVNPEFFELNKTCILNPTFGEGSILVRGADADLVIGDALIEIKTTKHLQFTQKHFNQLIGYYILSKIGGIDKMREGNEIKRLGIYFSRHAYLHLLNVKDVIEEEKLLGFIEWFKQRAKQEYN